MAFDGLSERLEAAFQRLKSKGSLTEADVRSAMREVRLALLEADVNYKVAKDFTEKVTKRAVGEQVMESLTPAQMVIKIVNEELTELMGGTKARLAVANHPPTVVMMCGLQGSGKTTHSGKIALKLKNEGHRPLLVACDIYRPAAIKQLQVVGESIGVPVFEMGQVNPVEIAKEAIKLAKDHGYDYVFLDTAGRLHIDEELMNELKNIKAEVKPHEILLVVDAMTGQDAVNVATSFNEALGIDGIVLTKLDVIPEAVRRFPQEQLQANRSSLSASAKSSPILIHSTPTVWRRESSEWAICFHLSKKRKWLLMRKRQWSLKRGLSRTSLI